MHYDFRKIEEKWQKYWAEHQNFKAASPDPSPGGGPLKPKFYVLDMFPYPSGAGLHVGHPLGYIASDIYARYKRHKGFNVLHPQGYDSFGLPAEQYAIQTGQHPAITTEENIKTYRRQLDKMGFSFDWSREVRTSDPKYYKWTQWIFIQLFNSWYNRDYDKAEDINSLISIFGKEGNKKVNAVCDEDVQLFTAGDWKRFSSKEKQLILLKYRLTYLAESEVNWCPALGTVLANDEIVNGVSERGGHPIIRKKMTQWSMRITAYAQRLLDGLDKVDWPQPLKDSQMNWIGRSVGAEVEFRILTQTDLPLAPSQGEGTASARIKDSSPRYVTSNSDIYPILLERAKEMRKNPTLAEKKLWDALRKRNLNYRFSRQHPISDYIVDFVCLEKELIIEVDGAIHQYQLNRDAERQLVLEQKKGYSVLRFMNEEVLNNIEDVLSNIERKLASISLPDYSENKNVSEANMSNSPSLGGVRGEVRPSKHTIKVFTTRPDTIFGASFMTLAPEHDLVPRITTSVQKAEVAAYIEQTAKRSERDRMADIKTISGAFTGAYAEHPFTKEPIPIWIGDYVLAGYGTGAVMSVPCGDQRDYDFAKHFNIPIPNIFPGIDISEEAFSDKDKTIIANSGFLNGLTYKAAVKKVIAELEKLGQGKGKVNYRLRDAVFSRQRYWGEPFPVYYIEGMPQMIDEKYLPIKLPEVEKYLPTETGEPPLGNAEVWAWDVKKSKVASNQLIDHRTVFPLELNTMPGWAGSSQYFNRYMDPHNDEEIFSQEAINYWQDVDLYIGGSEHATGHLLYSRFWQKFMFDKGLVPVDEYAKKLINQGMILGTSAFLYRWEYTVQENKKAPKLAIFISQKLVKKMSVNSLFLEDVHTDYNELMNIIFDYNKKDRNDKGFLTIIDSPNSISKIHAEVSMVNATDELDMKAFMNWRPEYKDAIFILDNGKIYNSNSISGGSLPGTFIVQREVEKMSKSKYNVVNPDAICEEYGADSLRLYEMFLGPLEQSKPWNTAGITGVHSFLKKLWKLFSLLEGGQGGEGPSAQNSQHKMENNSPSLGGRRGDDFKPSAENLKTLHKTIKKVEEDIENFSFNTSVSTFMICVNELTAQKCTSRAILEPLVILISPYAPHLAEELWEKLGHSESISTAPFPKFDAKYLVESSKEYPVSFNGKMRFTLELPLDMPVSEIETTILAHEKTQQQLQGRTPKKVIIVPGKIINIVG